MSILESTVVQELGANDGFGCAGAGLASPKALQQSVAHNLAPVDPKQTIGRFHAASLLKPNRGQASDTAGPVAAQPRTSAFNSEW